MRKAIFDEGAIAESEVRVAAERHVMPGRGRRGMTCYRTVPACLRLELVPNAHGRAEHIGLALAEHINV